MVNASITDFVPPVKVNPYDEFVTALASAGEGKAAAIVVPAADVNKTARTFGDAANAQGFTAKRRDTTVNDETVTADDIKALDGDVEVTLVFTLGPKQNRPGSGRTKDADDTTAKAKK